MDGAYQRSWAEYRRANDSRTDFALAELANVADLGDLAELVAIAAAYAALVHVVRTRE